MLIKSPMKKDKVKQNKRSNKKTSNRSSNRILTNRKNGKNLNNGTRKKKRKKLSFPQVKPWKIILGALAIGALGMLYLNHVFATQELLREVNQLEAEYDRVNRMHTDYKLIYDRMIGPAEIYENAKNAGFINGGPAEKVIEVDK